MYWCLGDALAADAESALTTPPIFTCFLLILRDESNYWANAPKQPWRPPQMPPSWWPFPQQYPRHQSVRLDVQSIPLCHLSPCGSGHKYAIAYLSPPIFRELLVIFWRHKVCPNLFVYSLAKIRAIFLEKDQKLAKLSPKYWKIWWNFAKWVTSHWQCTANKHPNTHTNKLI
jgi:hypothetical protein